MKVSATRTSVHEFEAIALENRYIRALIIPQLGGRVWELEDRIRGRQWIWHRGDVPLKAYDSTATYDDVWAGGWEELFPNDAPGLFEDRQLPDHGELWTSSWSSMISTDGSTAIARLATTTSIIETQCVKEYRLSSDEPKLSVRYSIRSLESRPFHFLFKQHLPVLITPECQLALSGGRAKTVDDSFGTMVSGDESFDWPLVEGSDCTTDMRAMPHGSSAAREFLYVRDVPEGWCGVNDIGQNASIRMDFDKQKLPYVWLFLTYGGWRNLYTAVLEPCTNMPKDLAKAVKLRQSAHLGSGEEFETSVSVTLGSIAELSG